MRKLKLLVTGLIIGQNLSAQNVGIGTTTQAAKLDVKTTCSYVGQEQWRLLHFHGYF